MLISLVEPINEILVGGLGLLDPFLVTSLKIGFAAKGLGFDLAEYCAYHLRKTIINFCSGNLVSIGNRSHIHLLYDNKANNLP